MRQTVETPRGGGALSGSGTGTQAGTGFPTTHQTRTSTLEPRTLPLDAPNRDPGADRSQHRTLSPGEEALHSESGAKMQPVPQRDRGDGVPYTKRVSRRRTCPICPFSVLIVGA